MTAACEQAMSWPQACVGVAVCVMVGVGLWAACKYVWNWK